jgi:hypothetical protein
MCWLVALLSCDDWVFTQLLARGYFLCCIARSDNIEHFALSYWQDAIGQSLWYANCWSHEATTTMIAIFMLYCNEQATMTTFFRSYCKGANHDTTIQTLRYARICGMMMKCNNQTLYTVNCQKWQQWRAYLYVVLQDKQRQLYSWCCKAVVLLEACNDNKPTIARREDATIKFLHAVYARITAMSICCTLYCKKQQQEWLIATKEHKTAPCNNQPNV